jgi:hypothetical protein
MSTLIREPIRPYWRALFIVLAGLLVETAAAIAKPQPMKTILDNVVSSHYLPRWLTDSVGPLPGGGTGKIRVAVFTFLWLVAIAVAEAIAHRLRIARRADSALRIMGSVAAEEGTYAELNETRCETNAVLAA